MLTFTDPPKWVATSCAMQPTATSSGSTSNSAARVRTSSCRCPDLDAAGRGGLGDLLQLRRDVYRGLPAGGSCRCGRPGGRADRRDRPVVSGRPACLQIPRWAHWSTSAVCSGCSGILIVASPKASLRVGGHRVLAETGGAYLEPTVVTGVPDNPSSARRSSDPCCRSGGA